MFPHFSLLLPCLCLPLLSSLPLDLNLSLLSDLGNLRTTELYPFLLLRWSITKLQAGLAAVTFLLSPVLYLGYRPAPTHLAGSFCIRHCLKSFVYRRQWHEHAIRNTPKSRLCITGFVPAQYSLQLDYPCFRDKWDLKWLAHLHEVTFSLGLMCPRYSLDLTMYVKLSHHLWEMGL